MYTQNEFNTQLLVVGIDQIVRHCILELKDIKTKLHLKSM